MTKYDKELFEALKRTVLSLMASISLLEHGGKKAAPSNKMFQMMMADYKKDLDLGLKTLRKTLS